MTDIKTPARPKLKRKAYEKKLRHLHEELVKLQEWVKATGAKIVIVFEGRDGAGKGGTIKALTERTSPRVFRVVALPAPSDREKSQMYMQRYINHLPAAGEIVIFDRSWYNRAGVERVMGFTPEQKVKKFLGGVPWIENAMKYSNIQLFKYWLEVSPDVQEERLKDRIKDKRKTWKLTDMDVKSFTRWDDYTTARDEMLAATDTQHSPWHIAHSDDKKQVRIDIISHLLASIPYEKVKSKKVSLPERKIKRDHSKGLKNRKVVPSVVVEQPAVEKASAEKRDVKKPVVKKSAVKTPVAKKPVVKKPVAEKTVVIKPVVIKPEVKKAAVKKPVVRKSTVKNPVVKKPIVKTPVVEKTPENV